MVGLIVLILVGILVFFLWDYLSASVEEKKETVLYKTSTQGSFFQLFNQETHYTPDRYYVITHSSQVEVSLSLFNKKSSGESINFRIFRGKFTNWVYSIEGY